MTKKKKEKKSRKRPTKSSSNYLQIANTNIEQCGEIGILVGEAADDKQQTTNRSRSKLQSKQTCAKKKTIVIEIK